VHHIDENPSNNDPLNLLPLCPNCHLTDQHNPTGGMEVSKLLLFRRFKDPVILRPQFHPLYLRLKFLDSVELNDSPGNKLEERVKELVEFVQARYGLILCSPTEQTPTGANRGLCKETWRSRSRIRAAQEAR